MNVILLERIPHLGQMGDVVKVKDGFGRNFLLPQGKALRATKENLSLFERQKAQLETANLERKSEAEQVAAKLDGMTVTIIRQAAEGGQLYGSVVARDIAEAVTEGGVTVQRRQVDLNRTIKQLGLFAVPVVLHPEVTVSVTVNVARSADEAAMQIERGGAIVGGLDDDDDDDFYEDDEAEADDAEATDAEAGAGGEAPAEDAEKAEAAA